MRALLALLLAATLSSAHSRAAPIRAAAPAPAHDLLATIDDCAGRLDSALDIGYARIAARCPELTPALSQSPWAAWLPADWKRPDNQLSAASLGELRVLIARESARDAARRMPPRTMRVGAVLAALTHSDAGASSVWQRFKDWLHRIFTPERHAGNDWLRRFLSELDLSKQATELIAWGAFGLVVALALAIVLSELRIAGIFDRRAAGARARLRSSPARGAASLEAIERAAPEEQPALLLELIAVRLIEQRRLPPARALTARELGRRADLQDEPGRGQLEELVAVSERVRFSGTTVGSAILASAMRSGRRLLATLDASPAATLETS
jgi:hypothetical protein